jgi:thioredoxin 1
VAGAAAAAVLQPMSSHAGGQRDQLVPGGSPVGGIRDSPRPPGVREYTSPGIRCSAGQDLRARGSNEITGEPMPTVTLTKENFEETITNNDTVLVDFWAEWCGPCKMFGPTFEKASEEHTDIVFAKVDTEDQPELAGFFNVRSIPTLMVFRENVILYSQPGALPPEMLEDLIGQVREIDMEDVHRKVAEAQAAADGEHSLRH